MTFLRTLLDLGGVEFFYLILTSLSEKFIKALYLVKSIQSSFF
jgi:hypothetical protein